ncbi:MAG: hypothetical protein MHM6MM_005374 [Cercozoa sp. M6MM]
MVSYDITANLARFLDPHMSVEVLSFLSEREVYDQDSVRNAMLNVVSKTKMIGLQAELEGKSEPDAAKKQQVLADIQAATEKAGKLIKLLSQPEFVANLEQNQPNLLTLADEYDVRAEDVEALADLAQLRYATGNYGASTAQLLHFYRLLTRNAERKARAAWGKLAVEIMSARWKDAAAEISKVKALIEKTPMSAAAKLQQRSCLMHWSLFVWFNSTDGKGRQSLIDQFFLDKFNLHTIQVLCPWLLRYLLAAVVLESRRPLFFELSKYIDNEEYAYSDPLLDFCRLLVVECDHAAALQALEKCESVLANDFFLSHLASQFVSKARLVFAAQLLSVHERMTITELEEKLGEVADLEGLLKDLERFNLYARIDEQNGVIRLQQSGYSVVRRIQEKTRHVTRGTPPLMGMLKKRVAEQKALRSAKKEE